MLSSNTLRNILKIEFNAFLKNLGYKNVRQLTKGFKSDPYDYQRIVFFLKKELSKSDSNLNVHNLNDFLCKKFFYEINNFHYIFNLDSIIHKEKNILLSDITSIFSNPELKYNCNLSTANHINKNELISSRIHTKNEDDEDVVTNIQFLIFVDEVRTKKGIIDLYCCVDIDLISSFVSLKFNHNLIENLEGKLNIVKQIVSMLQSNEGIYGNLKLRISTHNEYAIKKNIQKQFIELSQQAENLLASKADPNAKRKVNEFLKSMNIPKNDEYIKQIISVIYQDISKTFENSLFDKGWAFRFVFKEGDNTRASSSNDDLQPVYSKQVYWNLKELMYKKKGTDFIEAGLLWYTKDSSSPVAVKLEQKNNLMSVQYYKQNYNIINRKEKEQYVLRKIRKGFQKK